MATEIELLRQNQRYRIALACIKRSVDKLANAVRQGVYDSRSIVGDEVLNMLQEFEYLEQQRSDRP